MLLMIDMFIVFWYSTALGMSASLCRTYPDLTGWGNVSRSIAWPVTILELKWDQLN